MVVLAGERHKLNQFVGTAAQFAVTKSTDTVAAMVEIPMRNLAMPHEGASIAGSESMESTAVLDAAGLLGKIQSALIQAISHQLKVPPEDIDAEAGLSEFGFDSISLTVFGNTLNQAYGLELSPTIFFEYPTVHDFAEYLVGEHTQLLADKLAVRTVAKTVATKSVASIQVKTSASTMLLAADQFKHRRRGSQFASTTGKAPDPDPIAIIGMSGCFPGATDLDALWENLKAEKDCITEIPKSRWNWRAIYGDPTQEANKTNIKWGGFIEGVEEFDPLFFGISPREAELMDPQQRLLMTYAWKAIEDAGYSAQSLSGSKTGIFVGTASTGYSDLIAQADIAIEGYSSTGTVPSVGPNRMSYFLNLHGPSEPIETACSSSLVAIHRAVRAMQSGDCEMALVGGINTIVTPWAHISYSKAGMLCEDGRCKTFSKDANGYVRGEGVGMLFLKKLSHAQRDGDHIYGLIKGTAENHGGRANSLTAPNPKAQSELIKAAYREAKIDPRTVTYIETHGTGTPLGDPIEINGLKSAFGDLYQDAQLGQGNTQEAQCGIGSVKTNIGHLELAAGVAGVIKVLLQMKHQTLVKSLYCEEINPYIQLQGSPFYIVNETKPWQTPLDDHGMKLPRRAGISSFGFGGVNAHVIVEEYCASQADEQLTSSITPEHPTLIILSAKNEERLREQAKQLLAHVYMRSLTNIDLTNIAYTLQVGREAMEQRLAFTAATIDELKEKLAGYVESRTGMGEIKAWYQGEVTKNKEVREVMAGLNTDGAIHEILARWLLQGNQGRVLDLWVKGLSIDWATFYSENLVCGAIKPRRICLPTYPFARERYWVEASEPKSNDPASDAVAVLHPLLQLNTSDLKGLRFSSRCSGEEFFLSDHVVCNHKVLPGVAYLEMARAAVELSVGVESDVQTVVMLKNFVWMRPLAVRVTREVHIGLSALESGEIEFEIYSVAGSGEKGIGVGADIGVNEIDVIVHAQGRAALVSAEAPVERIDLEALRSQCDQSVDVEQCYKTFEAIGIKYGPAHRGLRSIQVGTQEDGQRFVLAQVQLPACVSDTADRYYLHPSVLDSALQASLGLPLIANNEAYLAGEVADRPKLPFALERLEIFDRSPRSAWVVVRSSVSRSISSITKALSAGAFQKLDIDIFDESGRVSIRFKGFTSRVLESGLSTVPTRAVGVQEVSDDHLLLLMPSWEVKAVNDAAIASVHADASVASADQALTSLYGERWVCVDSIYKECVPELEMRYPSVKWAVLPEKRDVTSAEWFVAASEQMFVLVQRLLQGKPKQAVLFQMVLSDSPAGGEPQTALSGLLKSAHQENPKFVGQVITLAQASSWVDIARALDENASDVAQSDQEIRYVSGTREVATMKELAASTAIEEERGDAAAQSPLLPWKDGGVYLITGGAGGLGLIFAREIASKVQGSRIILTGRSSISEERQERIEALKDRGKNSKVEYRVLDVSDANAVIMCVHSIIEQYGSLNGIVHSAGVISDNFIIKKTAEEFCAVLAPKVSGTINLDTATHSIELDFLILFSSITGAFGNVGQSDYATANAFMDRYAAYRNELVKVGKRHGRTLSINWPLWAEGGMRVNEMTQNEMQRQGFSALTTTAGIAALYRAWASNESQMVVLAGERHKLNQFVGTAAQFAVTKSTDAVAAMVEIPMRIPEKDGDPVTGLPEKIQNALTQTISNLLKVRPDDIDPDAELIEFGLDSISLTMFRNRLNHEYQLDLSPAIAFEHPTLRSLSEYLATEHSAVMISAFAIPVDAVATSQVPT